MEIEATSILLGGATSGESPSTVVIALPAASDTGKMHERTAAPSRYTVQAPHSPMPHPDSMPVKPRTSRSTDNRDKSGSTSTVRATPLTVIEIEAMSILLQKGIGKGLSLTPSECSLISQIHGDRES
jgi:hypothetical protein